MRRSVLTGLLAATCLHAFAADTTPLAIPSADKKSGISVELKEGWKTFKEKDGATTIDMPRSGFHIQIWALTQASVDEAAKQVTELVKSQVTHFKLTETKPVTVAGAEGKILIGTGEEADDGDPANAEVYLFAVEGKIYMICAHGEGDIATKSKAVLPALLASVKQS